jgi:glycine/D-amino acid oxidase-like deaminating enzyme
MKPTVFPGDAPSWWLRDADDADRSPPLAGPLDTDVAIVGGGYTGLWTALALRERDPGLRVALLEARFCGFGPSGRNGGFCHGYWSYLPTLRTLFGDDAALELCRAGDRIVPGIRGFLESRGEDAWLREGGMLQVSTTPRQDAAVDEQVVAARVVGHPEEAEPRAEPGISPRFRRGVFFRDGATVHPGRLVRALRRAALDAGVELYEESPAELRRDGTLSANGREVRSRHVVVATNAWATDWRPVAGRLTVFGSYVVLTEPVPDLLREIGWTGGEGIVDSRMFLHYFRTTADGRVLMGSGSGPIGRGNRIDRRFTHDAPTVGRAERGLRLLLPGLADARVEAAWGGPIDVAADHVPFFGTTAGRIHYALGYSGHGVGPSWLAGQVLASLVGGERDEWTALPLVNRRAARVPREPIRRVGGGLIRRALLACEEADEEGRTPAVVDRAVAAVPRLLGMHLGQR